jgi:hypothetical protein
MRGSRRIRREKQTIAAMIVMRCRALHGPQYGSCDDCSGLLRYAEGRIDRCVFGDSKPVCNRCSVHCYSPRMREEVRAVMRFSGPRMMLAHPVLAALHLADGVRFGHGKRATSALS